jgi:hypothetical protein
MRGADGVHQMSFCFGAFVDGVAQQGDGAGVELVGGVGFVVLEPGGESVGVLQDLFD